MNYSNKQHPVGICKYTYDIPTGIFLFRNNMKNKVP